MGREQFGQYGVLLATIGMFTAFAGFGLGATATKYVAQYKFIDPVRAGRIIALSSLVALITGVLTTTALLVFAPFLATHTLAEPRLSVMLRLTGGIVLLGAVNSAQMGALTGFEAFQRIARLNFYSGMLNAFAVAAGILVMGLTGALIGQTVALCFCCLLCSIALRSEAGHFNVPLNYAGCLAEREVLVRFSLPAVMSGIMVAPVNWICTAILVNAVNGYAEMGIYRAAASWQRIMLFLPGCVGAITLPMLSELHGSNQREKYRKALWMNLFVNGGTALLIFPVLSLFSKLIMRGYGPSFESGYMVIVLLGLSAIFFALGSVIGNAIASAGKMWFGFFFNGMWGIVYLVAAFMLAPKYGAVGLALANLIAYFLLFIIQLTYIKKV